jgi:hypothetical protein
MIKFGTTTDSPGTLAILFDDPARNPPLVAKRGNTWKVSTPDVFTDPSPKLTRATLNGMTAQLDEFQRAIEAARADIQLLCDFSDFVNKVKKPKKGKKRGASGTHPHDECHVDFVSPAYTGEGIEIGEEREGTMVMR